MNAIEPQTISAPATGTASRGAAHALTTGLAKTPQPASKLVRTMAVLPSQAPTRVSARAASQRAAGLRATLRLWWRRMTERRELAAMGERDLRDIGVTHAEAGQEIHKWFWQE
jgi:uncharacterized protein YjiS (DUF1127 family)